MTSKERVLTAAALGRPDRVPMDFNANPATMKRLMKDLGVSSLKDLLIRLHVDIIDIRGVVDPVYCGPISEDFKPTGSGIENYWGMRRKVMQTATGPENCYVDFPLADADSIEKIEAHNWPSVDWFDFEGFAEALEPWKDFAVMASGASVLQHPMLLCGMDKILMDMAIDPELASAVFDKFTNFYLAYYDKMLTAAKGRIDLFRIGDDIGTQRGPLISPPMFEQFIAPRLKLLADLAHSHGTKVMFHSCGGITEFIDALIEIGIDMLDPIQVRAAEMDPARIKKEYGSRICLHGSIDTQYVLPLESPQEVAQNVRRMIDILGSGGGFILAPCHVLQTDVPTANVCAMYETGFEHGAYAGI
ncbi:MAG: uroporphyrinogen decarboxylase family protein [Planctomycetota bacterium]|jgi:uroporphyrinogen decarboxylase